MVYDKEYYENNKDKFRVSKKKYYGKNRDVFIERAKEYYENNKEHCHENMRKIREKNKEKITCECGTIISKNSIWQHRNSKKHQNYINDT